MYNCFSGFNGFTQYYCLSRRRNGDKGNIFFAHIQIFLAKLGRLQSKCSKKYTLLLPNSKYFTTFATQTKVCRHNKKRLLALVLEH